MKNTGQVVELDGKQFVSHIPSDKPYNAYKSGMYLGEAELLFVQTVESQIRTNPSATLDELIETAQTAIARKIVDLKGAYALKPDNLLPVEIVSYLYAQNYCGNLYRAAIAYFQDHRNPDAQILPLGWTLDDVLARQRNHRIEPGMDFIGITQEKLTQLLAQEVDVGEFYPNSSVFNDLLELLAKQEEGSWSLICTPTDHGKVKVKFKKIELVS